MLLSPYITVSLYIRLDIDMGVADSNSKGGITNFA